MRPDDAVLRRQTWEWLRKNSLWLGDTFHNIRCDRIVMVLRETERGPGSVRAIGIDLIDAGEFRAGHVVQTMRFSETTAWHRQEYCK